jgi:3-phosphoshikimate 1-carboxyvinyltransferase
MLQKFQHIPRIDGNISLPGDKSISHRTLIFSALANGSSVIKNLADSEDVNTTVECLIKLGTTIKKTDTAVIIEGVGANGFEEPDSLLYCGNSGTTSRLISGLLAAQNFPAVITGDNSLLRRPMKRIINPLQKMGCTIKSNNGKLPLHFLPSGKIRAIDYTLPVASAQIKGAVLLAGVHCEETTTVVEKNLFSRDHTERMLNLPVKFIGKEKVTQVSDTFYPQPAEYFIPGDISTAAFFIVLTVLSENSELQLRNISLNRSRTHYLDVLINMGADIKIEITGESNNEPYGNIFVKSSRLKNIEIDSELIPTIIDEIPILSVAGVFADGEFVINRAKELRVKESDRLSSICSNLRRAGLDVYEYDDGFSISGELSKSYQSFESFEDHRIAMALSILACLMEEGSEVNEFECISISNPHFIDQLNEIKAQ